MATLLLETSAAVKNICPNGIKRSNILSLAKTGAARLLNCPTGRAFGRTSAALTRTVQPTTSGSASFVTMV
jgi:hypothetical protein